MKQLLKPNDIFQGMKVIKVSDHYCFFDKKRLSWSKIQKLIDSEETVKYKKSPNKIIDWTNKKNVLDYHDSFEEWSFYISLGLTMDRVIHADVFTVEDNLILYNNEYYLPSPYRLCEKQHIKNGKYNVRLMKTYNDWFGGQFTRDQEAILLNVFIPGSQVTKTIKDITASRFENISLCKYDDTLGFQYELDILNGASFELYKFNITDFFKRYFIYLGGHEGKLIDIKDSELQDILHPIEEEVISILSDALRDKENFDIDVDYSYGEIEISNCLTLNKSVSSQIFDLIIDHIKKI